jgi:hypothetical protein
MHRGAQRLARLLTHTPDPSECERCLDALEDYCSAQQAGADVAALFPAVAEHLDACVACAEAYALLYDTLLAGEGLPEAGAVPTPDLSFVRAGWAPTLAGVLAGAIEQAGTRLRVAFSQALLELAPPPSQAGLAFRSPGDPEPILDLTWEQPAGQVDQLQVAILPSPDEQRCDVRVRVAVAGRTWPDLEGIQVRLRAGDTQQDAATDAWGEALFRSVARASVAQLVVDVEV